MGEETQKYPFFKKVHSTDTLSKNLLGVLGLGSLPTLALTYAHFVEIDKTFIKQHVNNDSHK